MATNFSLKKLISRSAAQLIYLNQHPDKDIVNITPLILEGQKYQQTILNKLNESSYYIDEMGGVYTDCKGNNIYFSHDIVKNDGTEIFETKYANEGNISNDYIIKSALQCAIYDTLTKFSSLWLNKSKFARINNNNITILLRQTYQYYLSIGNRFFKIIVTNPYPILDFIDCKANIVTQGNYDEARKFDANWKGNEHNILRNCFKVVELTHPYLL